MKLEEFIRTSIASMDDLRVLLLFQRESRAKMSISEIAGKLYLPPATAAQVLNRLAARKLLAASGDPVSYQYQPASSELAEMVGQLVELDKERPVSLMKMIYPHAGEVQAFADAFRIKKEKEQ